MTPLKLYFIRREIDVPLYGGDFWTTSFSKIAFHVRSERSQLNAREVDNNCPLTLGLPLNCGNLISRGFTDRFLRYWTDKASFSAISASPVRGVHFIVIALSARLREGAFCK